MGENMNKFKSKRKIKIKFRYVIYIIIVILIYQLFIYVSTNLKIVKTNEEFISKILSNSNYHLSYNQNHSNIFNYILKSMIDVNNPVDILRNQNENKVILSGSLKLSSYEKNRTIYIYNTHDLEQYNNSILKNYNIKSDVNMASTLLSKTLNNLGINVIIEPKKTSEILSSQNLDYNKSFDVSKTYIKEAMKENNIDLFIDLHSDDVSRELTTTVLDEKKYAKVIFSVGKNNENFNQNYELVQKLNKKIIEIDDSLSRGIIINDKQNYNQELSQNMIFINIGGYENTIDEVLNTIEVISPLIKEILYEERENS